MTQLSLAIETSTPMGSIALGTNDVVLAEIVLGENSRHSEQLLPALDYALRIANAQRQNIRRLVIGSGPGSFTGLRIAAATAKGLAAALDLGVFGFSGLLAVAASTGVRDRAICAMFDARRTEVYAACYRIGQDIEVLLEPRVEPMANVLDAMNGLEAVVAGEGALKHKREIEQCGHSVLPQHLSIPRASALLWLAHAHPQYGRIQDLRHWEPDYLRTSGAERGVRG